MSIYTKKGNKGETCLFDNQQTSKKSLIISAIGVIDELNSYLGVVISASENTDLKKTLRGIQGDLLVIGSTLAGSGLRFSGSKTKKLEKIIDGLEKKLPSLRNFIVPGGSKVSSHLHFARSLARRAERVVVALNGEKKVKPQILRYLNRLSDALFILAREENNKLGIVDEVWKHRK